jgi:hypothetical protein
MKKLEDFATLLFTAKYFIFAITVYLLIEAQGRRLLVDKFNHLVRGFYSREYCKFV